VSKAVRFPAAAIEQPLALAFVNTLFVEDGTEIDGLSSPKDVERWYRRVAPAYANAPLLDAQAEHGLRRLRILRSTLRLALQHHVRVQAMDADARSLQDVLGAALLAPVFGVADGRVVVEAAPQTGTFVDRLIRDIADSFVDLLNVTAPERIKRCGGEDCVLFLSIEVKPRAELGAACAPAAIATKLQCTTAGANVQTRRKEINDDHHRRCKRGTAISLRPCRQS